ncbi:MAG: type I-C CRISPR-associated protein Cas7/Csd2 [Firmicutes bacterium]|nr:type I-C CRISPR-associated protein Cas7/Csd2 [Bacillota bacterium]
MKEAVKNRYEFVLFFDVENGNPNGDPDAGNLPRIDPETGHGLVTDVCIKRKIRNYIELVKGGQEGFEIYVKEGAVLNTQHRKAYDAHGWDPKNYDQLRKEQKDRLLTEWMCAHFYDIRAFGAVMSTEINCGQVRGPVQLNFGRSIDPVVQQEITITRVAVTSEKAEKEREMGRKHIIPYGLYRIEGYVSAPLAQKTGFSEEDLELLWEALVNMFEHDRSAARGKMASRKLFIFKHESMLGNAPAHKLFELIKAGRIDEHKPARSFNDYEITVAGDKIPQGVTLIEKL